MSKKSTKFIGMVTFDASSGHDGIIKKLEAWGFFKKTTYGYDLPANTYIGEFQLETEVNDNNTFNTTYLKNVCSGKSKYYRQELKKYFDDNNIDGHIYVLFSWELTFDDSVTIKD
ncbi:hypothetical protein M2010_001268 [Providencia stuartii]|uniref:hypothetical protein n=1 Tax=Providencia stuartii TaxID=588 RepID=UPI0012B5F0E1|nr:MULTISPECIES: hypothetical protein [Providencia]MDT2040924.1 hypothetical protein [Providencia stuartii]MTC13390.1 hypothetical protein [Providencia stuartii]GHB89856.1 hypothetical protein GCM10007290_14870 [Providencia thailandensis]HEM7144222.1 hypothetical protein [Providencia stuartii]